MDESEIRPFLCSKLESKTYYILKIRRITIPSCVWAIRVLSERSVCVLVVGDTDSMSLAREEDPDPRLLLLPEEERSIEEASMAKRLTPMFLFFLALFLTLNSVVVFILDKTCRDNYTKAICDESPQPDYVARHVSSKAELWNNLCITALTSLSLLFTSFLSASCDAVGRKPVMLLATGSMALCSGGCTVAILAGWPIWSLVPFYFLAGVGGTFGTFNAALFALTADSCSNEQELKRSYAFLEAAIFVAGIVGPLVGGYLQTITMWLPFAAATALYVLTMLFIALALPETMRNASIHRVAEMGGFWRATWSSLSLLRSGPDNPRFGSEDDRSVKRLGGLRNGRCTWCLVFFLGYSAIVGSANLMPAFTRLKYNFDSVEIGELSSTSYGGKALALTTLLPALIKRYGREAPVIACRFGCALGALFVVGYGLCPNATAMFCFNAIEAFDVILLPVTRAVLCESVGEQDRGKALGLVANLETLSALVTPNIFGSIYSATVDTCSPSLAFWVLGGVCGGSATLLSWRLEVPVARKAVGYSFDAAITEDGRAEGTLVYAYAAET